MLLPRSLFGTLSIIIIFLFFFKKTVFKIQKQTESHWVFLIFFEAARFVPLLFNYGHYSLRTLFNHVQLKVHEGVIALLISSSFFCWGALGARNLVHRHDEKDP